MNEETELVARTIRASGFLSAIYCLTGAAGIAGSIFYLQFYAPIFVRLFKESPEQFVQVIGSNLGFALFFAALALPVSIDIFVIELVKTVRRYPRISVNEDGLTYASVFGREHWRWSETGPFRAYHPTFVSREWDLVFPTIWPVIMPEPFICAYSSKHHQSMASQNTERQPVYADADIRLAVCDTGVGRKMAAAHDFADELNRWRARYGEPFETGEFSDPQEAADDLQWKLFLKRTSRFASPLLILAIIFLLFEAVG